ncbi:hypothetical protein HDU67_009632 [Dinochytrium kinnereticum]|nr:hypothetical protein HDU67_009632 [Dinochytrium kinnereticum]
MFPPWRQDLEKAIESNQQSNASHLFASLATIKPYGRPANRTVFFRGFLSDICLGKPDADAAVEDDAVLEKINNVLVFAADARSGHVDDLIHGSRFGEICWFMPGTKEQFRISGELHLVACPHHPLSLSHRVPVPFSSVTGPLSGFNKMDWEAKRLDVWRRLSSVRRASFAWPAPGKPQAASHLESPQKPLTATAPGGPTVAVLAGGVATVPPPSLCSIITHLDADATPGTVTADPASGAPLQRSTSGELRDDDSIPPSATSDAHAVALQNFCLLLLDVDGADHLRMAQVPHVRTKYRRSMEAWSEDHLEDLFLSYGGGEGGGATHHQHHHRHGGSRHGSKPHSRAGSHPHAADSLLKKVAHWTVKEVNP